MIPEPVTRRKSKLFTRQELTLFVLHLLQINPAHGYEIIKTIEGYSMGAYIPSPGVIYPILTFIVEEGFATATDIEGGKKQFTMTPAGSAFSDAQKKEIRIIEEKMKTHVINNRPPPAPELLYAIENLKITIRAKFYNGEITPEKYAKIIEYVNDTTRKINEL